MIISTIPLFLVWLFVFSVNAQTEGISQTVKTIQQVIMEKGVNWVAGETTISKLPRKERLLRLGGLHFHYIEPQKKTDIIDQEVYMQSELPAQLDWRNYHGQNWVTSIKDQGHCGSCWAFAPIASFESRIMVWSLDSSLNPDYSEQFLVSCSDAGTCDGGWDSYAQDYMQTIGVPEESCFPYDASDDTCRPCPGCNNRQVKIESWHWIDGDYMSTNVEFIKSALMRGPVTTFMIIHEDFLYYSGGIYQHVYGIEDGGHCVCIVGWDDTTSPPCWIVKNSWGTGWGEMGFFKIKMGVNEVEIEAGTSYLIPNIQPVIDFTGAPGNGIVPLAVVFKAISNGGTVDNWLWDFGDGTFSSERDPIHTYLSLGNYAVSLVAVGPEGSDTEIKTNYINVITRDAPDLSGKWIQFSSSFSNKYLHGRFEVSNMGTQNAGKFIIGFYLSGDGTTSGSLLRKITVRRGLESGEKKECSFRYFSRASHSGKYIIAVVDSDNQIIETDKMNNRAAQKI